MNYETAVFNIQMQGSTVDGYRGETAKIYLSLVDDVWYVVTHAGCYKAGDVWEGIFFGLEYVEDNSHLQLLNRLNFSNKSLTPPTESVE